MGRDKAFLPLHGQPLIYYPMEVMKRFCSEIFIVTQTPEFFSAPSLSPNTPSANSPVPLSQRGGVLHPPAGGGRRGIERGWQPQGGVFASTPLEKGNIKILTDIYTEAGPMGGIFTGLQNASNRWALVLPCDMPYVRKELIAGLSNGIAAHYDAEAVVPLSPERQPLCALYSKSALPVFYKRIRAGEHSLVSVLSELETKYVHWLQLDPEDEQGISFLNVNTPQDLGKARAHIPWQAVRRRAYC